MATIRYPNGNEHTVPDSARPTDHGVEWTDEGLHHVVPWGTILEAILPARKPKRRAGE